MTAARLHRVDAIVLTPARRATATAAVGRTGYQAKAAWTDPAGQQDTGTVDVTRHALPGSTVSIRVTDAGRLAAPPASAADLVGDAACFGLLTLGCLSVLVASGLGLRLHFLARTAARGWQDSWARTEPVWTGRSLRGPGTHGPQPG
ncbi:hypothetical protein GCM10009665_10560 [Kitasatospora nipponensis]|uniref:Uncharacterized protein n=1 Tax=Kitasatospora nipponensis TaxID=258049 RepID=A0ABP4GE14_9ACTN